MKASEQSLENLHHLVALTLTEAIERMQSGEDPVNPQVISQALKMLKDNGIQSDEENLEELKASVAQGLATLKAYDPDQVTA